jgi:hypothetical protein
MVAAAGAVAFVVAWLVITALMGERWQDALPAALAGAVAFGLINFGSRWWARRRSRGSGD